TRRSDEGGYSARLEPHRENAGNESCFDGRRTHSPARRVARGRRDGGEYSGGHGALGHDGTTAIHRRNAREHRGRGGERKFQSASRDHYWRRREAARKIKLVRAAPALRPADRGHADTRTGEPTFPRIH